MLDKINIDFITSSIPNSKVYLIYHNNNISQTINCNITYLKVITAGQENGLWN